MAWPKTKVTKPRAPQRANGGVTVELPEMTEKLISATAERFNITLAEAIRRACNYTWHRGAPSKAMAFEYALWRETPCTVDGYEIEDGARSEAASAGGIKR